MDQQLKTRFTTKKIGKNINPMAYKIKIHSRRSKLLVTKFKVARHFFSLSFASLWRCPSTLVRHFGVA